jgi:hypothetical protein
MADQKNLAQDGLIQSPALNASGEPTQRSIKDVFMAQEVVKTIIAANRERQIVNGRILAKYNAERPYSSARLHAEGLGWKQNFTTKPLPSMIEKVAPRFVRAVAAQKYLTNSSLSSRWENAVEKTEMFREHITKTIRARKGWTTLVEDIAFTNALFGHSVPAWLDEFTWFPKTFAQDEIYLSDGTKQLPSTSQVVVLRETFMPHELYAYIKDKEAAETVGWDIAKTITAINKASPNQVRNALGDGTSETWYQNAARELTLGASYMGGASVVVVYSLLVREVTGKVSHYRLAGNEYDLIFEKEDRFNSMDDCVAFFAFQKGNGTMHGSKGVGRDIYEMAGMIDRTRNEIVDRSILSGKSIFQGDIKQIHKFKMSVVGAALIVPQGWTLLEQKIDGNVEDFVRLDAFFGMIVDQLIGSTSPPKIEGEAFRSPAAVNLYAQREEEQQDVRIARFLEQFVSLVGTMQRRLCDKETVEDDAKALQEELLEHMSREELDELASQPVAGTVTDLTPLQRQLIVSLAAEKRGNPLYNQRQLEVEDLTARLNPEFAKRVLLPENDPTVQAEQQRLQQMELMLIQSGAQVPVSPRDNHMIHLDMLMPVAEQLAGSIMQGQGETEQLEPIIAHIMEHYNRALEQGVPKDKLKPVADLVNNAAKAIEQLKQLDQQAADLQQQSSQHDAEEAIIEQEDQQLQPPTV